jgi:hypothetical protein
MALIPKATQRRRQMAVIREASLKVLQPHGEEAV